MILETTPSPVPGDAKSARMAAFTFSAVGLILLLVLPGVFVLLFLWGGRNSNSVSVFGTEINSGFIVAPFVLGSLLSSGAGFVRGLANRNAPKAKAAYLMGGIVLLVWLLLFGLLGFVMLRDVDGRVK